MRAGRTARRAAVVPSPPDERRAGPDGDVHGWQRGVAAFGGADERDKSVGAAVSAELPCGGCWVDDDGDSNVYGGDSNVCGGESE